MRSQPLLKTIRRITGPVQGNKCRDQPANPGVIGVTLLIGAVKATAVALGKGKWSFAGATRPQRRTRQVVDRNTGSEVFANAAWF
jgi:hypothetical protein